MSIDSTEISLATLPRARIGSDNIFCGRSQTLQNRQSQTRPWTHRGSLATYILDDILKSRQYCLCVVFAPFLLRPAFAGSISNSRGLPNKKEYCSFLIPFGLEVSRSFSLPSQTHTVTQSEAHTHTHTHLYARACRDEFSYSTPHV